MAPLRLTVLLTLSALLAVGALPAAAQVAKPQPGPAYLLIELPSMRVVAESRREVLSAAVAPGSVMKLVTLVAALENGVADASTRILCRGTADLDGHPITCVHADVHRALGPDEALGHSCNVYFATVAKRIPRSAIDAVLVRAGLAPSSASVPMTRIGLGLDGIRATPRQLLEAFLRLSGATTMPLALKQETRAVVRRGLEMAVREGTASALWQAGYSGLAKTGTAPMPGGGYLGLVVAAVNAERPTHAVVVVAPGTSGANAAALAAGLLETHRVPHRPGAVRNPDRAGPSPGGRSLVRVGSARRTGGYDVSSVAIEDLVARAVAGEGGDALPRVALEALAMTIRTFAVRNVGRHSADGFDLCDLTHCVVQRAATAVSTAAATATAGRILFSQGRPADVYFSASCGGHTERPSAVWAGASDPPYLPAVADEVCVREAPWVVDLTEPQVRRVLESAGLRGGRVDDVRVASRSASGRVAALSVRGMVPDRIDANTFRSAAGRLLGWHTIKSTLFQLVRTGNGYRLTGRGLGHGVGLCVVGAAARAAGGAEAAAILSFYFPGASIGRLGSSQTDVRVVLPETDRAQLPAVRAMIQRELQSLAAKLGVAPAARIDVVFHSTTESYVRETGLPWWTAGRTSGARIDLLPLTALTKRGIVERTVRHELVHVLTDAVLAERPLWVREGLARTMAGEQGEEDARPSRVACPSDSELRDSPSPEAWKRAYATAGQCVARALAAGTPWRDLR